MVYSNEERAAKVFWSGFFGLSLIVPHIYLFLLPFKRWDRPEIARAMVISSIMSMLLLVLGIILLALLGIYFEGVKGWPTWITLERKIIWIESVIITLFLGTLIRGSYLRRLGEW